jgi:hypothetical protein
VPAPTAADLPVFLRFTPVPGKARHDGWSPDHQLRFIVALARGSGVDQAAELVGRSRQGAYQLRRRPGAEEFAAAWDAALRFAGAARGSGGHHLPRGLGSLLVPRFYRGRLLGFTRRDEVAGLMATIARLDRIAGRFGPGPGKADKDDILSM